MDPSLFLLSKEEMRARFEGKGSPDYPTHHGGCVCSGCYASWCEWRGGFAAVQAVRSLIEEPLRADLAKVTAQRDALIATREATEEETIAKVVTYMRKCGEWRSGRDLANDIERGEWK